MAVRFRNRDTGRIITRPEPDDEPVRRQRERQRAIAKLDKSPLWQRVDRDVDVVEVTALNDAEPVHVDADPQAQQAEPTAPPEPKPADVRAWAAEQGIEVSPRGKLPADVVRQFQEARGGRGLQDQGE